MAREWAHNKRVQQGVCIALAALGFVILFLSKRDQDHFPHDLLYLASFILVIGSSHLYRWLRQISEKNGEEPRRRALMSQVHGRGVIAAVTAFYAGVIFSKLWSVESVDLSYHYLWIALVSTSIYLLAMSDRVEKQVREEFGEPQEEADDEEW